MRGVDRTKHRFVLGGNRASVQKLMVNKEIPQSVVLLLGGYYYVGKLCDYIVCARVYKHITRTQCMQVSVICKHDTPMMSMATCGNLCMNYVGYASTQG